MLQELMTAKEIKDLPLDNTKIGDQIKRLLQSGNKRPSAAVKVQFTDLLKKWRKANKKSAKKAL